MLSSTSHFESVRSYCDPPLAVQPFKGLIQDLAIIDNPKYDHFDFYAGGSTGVDGVTVRLQQ